MNYTEWRSCKTKIRYRSEKKAFAKMKKNESNGIKNLTVYKCKFCSGWHIGHSVPSKTVVVRLAETV